MLYSWLQYYRNVATAGMLTQGKEMLVLEAAVQSLLKHLCELILCWAPAAICLLWAVCDLSSKHAHPAFMSLQDTTFLWCFYEDLPEGHNCPQPAVTQRRVLEEDQPHVSGCSMVKHLLASSVSVPLQAYDCKSWDHRMVWVGRNLEDHPSNSPATGRDATQ